MLGREHSKGILRASSSSSSVIQASFNLSQFSLSIHLCFDKMVEFSPNVLTLNTTKGVYNP